MMFFSLLLHSLTTIPFPYFDADTLHSTFFFSSFIQVIRSYHFFLKKNLYFAGIEPATLESPVFNTVTEPSSIAFVIAYCKYKLQYYLHEATLVICGRRFFYLW